MIVEANGGYEGELFAASVDIGHADLARVAKGIRLDVVRLSYSAATHHIAPALSCVDILVALYFGYLHLPPDSRRDFFFLSKGHAALALYVVLAARGLLPICQLRAYCRRAEAAGLGQHPSPRSCIGLENTSGSLGHALSIAAGCALANRRLSRESRAVVLLGDGELNEGSVWEAASFAAHQRLGNLTAIVDVNAMQCLGRTEEILDMRPLAGKFAAFGWSVHEACGHDIDAILAGLRDFDHDPSTPFVLLAQTVKGKGVSFMEGSSLWHHRRLTPVEFQQAVLELTDDATHCT